MKYLLWTVIVFIVGYAIYWIMDWQSKHEDGE